MALPYKLVNKPISDKNSLNKLLFLLISRGNLGSVALYTGIATPASINQLKLFSYLSNLILGSISLKIYLLFLSASSEGNAF